MNWLPTGDQVLLKLQEKTDKTQSGIIIMTGTDEYRYADVVKTGPGLFTQTGDRIPMAVKEGDEIMIHSNQIGDHKEVSIAGEKYHLVRESEIALIKQQ